MLTTAEDRRSELLFLTPKEVGRVEIEELLLTLSVTSAEHTLTKIEGSTAMHSWCNEGRLISAISPLATESGSNKDWTTRQREADAIRIEQRRTSSGPSMVLALTQSPCSDEVEELLPMVSAGLLLPLLMPQSRTDSALCSSTFSAMRATVHTLAIVE